MFYKRAFDADAYIQDVVALFSDPPPRPTFRFRGNLATNRRDALWFGERDIEGRLPLYRVYANAYADPHRATGLANAVVPQDMPPFLSKALRQLETIANHRLNHVVLHRYKDGSDVISWHRDKTMDLTPGSPIVSASLGSERVFKLGTNEGKTLEARRVEHGDVVVLPYETNLSQKHCISRTAQPVGPRYSITARCMRSFFGNPVFVA
jgi:hypothetical protein